MGLRTGGGGGRARHQWLLHSSWLLHAISLSLLVACNAYDDKAVQKPRPDAGHTLVDGGDALGDDAGAHAGSGATAQGGSGGHSAGTGSTKPDAGIDCTPNPGSKSCPMRCTEQCNGKDDDCDGKTDEDAEQSCSTEHTVGLCSSGSCLIVECDDNYRDCDEDPDNGCETSLDDPSNCGRCGRVCKLDHATAGCEAGECIVDTCSKNFGDCDRDGLSCETPLNTLMNCGACGAGCGGLDHASPQCDDGSCGVKHCLGNFEDCDGEADNGCETTLDSLDDCAGCNMSCDKASCGGGVCTAAQCSGSMADCDRDEVDCEVDLASDVANCGGCGLGCAFDTDTPRASLECTDNDCKALCVAGYGDCDEDYATGCETLLDSPTHCGSCVVNCDAALANTAETECSAGGCVVLSCASGFGDCDGETSNGCERDINQDGPCFPDTNCEQQTDGTHQYFFCTNAIDWDVARERCQIQRNGDLARIDSSTENTFVQTHVGVDAWIGARDSALEGLWSWSNNGVPFWRGTGGGVTLLSQYAHWSAGEPNDAAGAEDCAQILADGTWNDIGCSSAHGFVCEIADDACPSDDAKLDPGQCGCGMAETDADGDGFAICNDACDGDAAKQSAGSCGCGVADTDSDGDGSLDCNDGCPNDPTKPSSCLVFTPTNFDPTPVNWSMQPTTTLDCGGAPTIDTTDPDGAGPLIATVSGWCGTPPTPITQSQTQPAGPELVIIPLRGLTIAASNTLRLIGTRPVVLAVDGNIVVNGTIDANASGVSAGAGGNWSCGTSQGGNGSGDTARFNGASGGGGGGFRSAGGRAGTANTDGGNINGGIAGVARGNDDLVPLFGGCAGGRGGDCATDGGGGGGGFELIASGSIDINGTLRANGAAGATPCGSNDEGGGTGGGSGGAILLEGTTVDTSGSMLQVSGGNGGHNGGYAGIYNCGNTSGGNGSTSAGNAGGTGTNCQGGSSGGGGGYGRVRTITH